MTGWSETVQPGTWVQLLGIWVRARTLPDPLLGGFPVLVTVHRDATDIWVDEQGAVAGLRWQTREPDFADIDGGPL